MAAASSSSSDPQWIHDVFINFRGEDTRKNIVSHLYAALSNAGINTFLDDENLRRGMELGPELRQAIEGSRISIVVFSKTYTSSTWCLKELEQIMKCRRNHGQMVVPIFYNVDPSDLRHQKDGFGKALKSTAKKRSLSGERMDNLYSKWKSVLTEAATISGWHTKNFGNDAELVSRTVEDVRRKLSSRSLNITEHPVGLDTRVQEVTRLFDIQTNKLCLIGIWGMGGSGKTTTARAIYNKINSKFVSHSFIENIREVCNRGDQGIILLQEQLLSNVLKPSQKIHSTASGITTIEKLYMGKRALIVLDDVSTFEQVEALCGNRKCFGSGSVLIVTSRDVNILKKLQVHYIYSIKEMDEIKSLELFSWHAFKEPSPKDDFRELSSSIVTYCRGLPLALEVIGSYLRARTIKEWRSVLLTLERIPDNQVHEKLRISYDGLKKDTEKDIFLHICCFFIGKDRAYVSEIIDGCDLYAGIGITVLIERSLLKVEKNNKLGMHDLLRDMGREIVRERSIKLLGKRCRLWFHEDAHKVLTEKSGTETVEGLVLKSQSTSNVCIETDTFKEMKNLRLLRLDHVDLFGAFKYLSKELRWLHWKRFSREYIPDDFYLENLVVFELKHSNIKRVWNETKLMDKLKILNLSHSKYLTSTPDFSKLPNLEKLIMKDCPRLSEVHQSIGDLRNLLLINLEGCTSLSNLPENINQLKSLTTLILSGCSKIDRLEEGIVQMESLTTLVIKGTGVKEVPYSVVRLNSIGYISLCGYEGLSQDVFHSFIQSWMSPTMNFSLNNLDFLTPIVRSLQQLRTVWIQCHSENQLTQELKMIFDDQYDTNYTESEAMQSPNDFLRSHLIGMRSLPTVMDTLGKRISQGLTTTNGSSNFFLPGGNHPSCLAYTGVGPSAPFQVPKDIDCHMEGIVLRVVYSSRSENMAAECLTSVLIVNYTKCTIHIYNRDTIMSFNDEDWKNLTSNLGPGDDVKIYVAFGHGLIVKKTIVYLVSGQSIIVEVDDANMEVEPPEEVNMQPSLEVKVEQSPKPRSIFTRLPNRIGAFLCLNQQRDKGSNNF
ncbi:disease resistance protein RUN1-like [Trifolium pratense]|nr:disease resistance protein RUN1-like [Trifolium pratense]